MQSFSKIIFFAFLTVSCGKSKDTSESIVISEFEVTPKVLKIKPDLSNNKVEIRWVVENAEYCDLENSVWGQVSNLYPPLYLNKTPVHSGEFFLGVETTSVRLICYNGEDTAESEEITVEIEEIDS